VHRLITVFALLSIVAASCGADRDTTARPTSTSSVESEHGSDSTEASSGDEDDSSSGSGADEDQSGLGITKPVTETTAPSGETAATVTFGDGSTFTVSHGEINAMRDELESESTFVDAAFGGSLPPGFGADVLTRSIIVEAFRRELDGAEVDLALGQDNVADELVGLMSAADDPEAEAARLYDDLAYIRLVASHLSHQHALVNLLVEDGPKESLVPCVSHILVETKSEADDLLAELADGADFAELAIEHSTGPSGPNGGQLGCAPSSGYVAPFADAVDEADKGVPTGPVESEFGWHVVLVSSYDALPLAYESVNGALAESTIDIDERVGVWDARASAVIPNV